MKIREMKMTRIGNIQTYVANFMEYPKAQGSLDVRGTPSLRKTDHSRGQIEHVYAVAEPIEEMVEEEKKRMSAWVLERLRSAFCGAGARLEGARAPRASGSCHHHLNLRQRHVIPASAQGFDNRVN